MDWIRSFQRSIDYIEDNITGRLEIGGIARQMNVSPFYYQKIFSIMCGFTVGEYIRSRRLTLAGAELARTNAGVTDTALKYGYDTPEGFARAFTRFHGASPSEVKRGAPLRSCAKLSVTIIMKGGGIMDYKVVKKDSFRVFEKRTVQTVSEDRNLQSIPEFWEDSHKDGTVTKLLAAASDREYVFGICYANPHKDESEFDYSIAALAPDGAKAPEGFTENVIPARTWLVFGCRGAMPDAVQQLWHRICAEFFPSSGYEPTYEMDIEAYTDGDMSNPDYRCEIWVPVKETGK